MIAPGTAGLLLVVLTGILGGSFLAPIKLDRFRFRHAPHVSCEDVNM
jgi:hypothetical protein